MAMNILKLSTPVFLILISQNRCFNIFLYKFSRPPSHFGGCRLRRPNPPLLGHFLSATSTNTLTIVYRCSSLTCFLESLENQSLSSILSSQSSFFLQFEYGSYGEKGRYDIHRPGAFRGSHVRRL